MVRWARGYRGLVIVLAILGAVMMFSAVTKTAHAEGENAFPGITGGTDWGFNNPNNNVSPNPLLMWQFKPGAANKYWNTEHILRNNQNGRNKGTRLRVYYTQRPQAITVSINVGYCELNANNPYDGDVVVNLGGQEKYRQPTNGRKITSFDRYWTWQYSPRYANDPYPYVRAVDTSKDTHTSAGRNNSPVCQNFSNSFTINKHYENCNNQSGSRCAGNGTETYGNNGTTTGTIGPDGAPFGKNYAVGNKLDGMLLSVPFPQTGTGNGSLGYDANTGLWFADLDIDLTAGDETNVSTPNDQQFDFKVTASDAFTSSGVRMHALMGYRYFPPQADAAKYFGLQGNGQDAGPWPDFGQKFAIPFGMSCGDSRASISNARIIMYDPDTNHYGDSYVMVFKRDSNGIQKLTQGEYNLIQNATWDSTNKRIKIHDTQSSVIEVRELSRGVNYMLVLVNPSTNYPPSENIWSLFLPTDSINGLINCNYNLKPHLNEVQPAFSAYGDTLTPHGWITNDEASTTTGDHAWQITRAVFSSRPADLLRTTVANTNNRDAPCDFIRSQSGSYSSCQSVYNGTYPADSDKRYSDTVGAYPAGTYVCYVTSVYNPTLAISDDEQWANSPMQCSVAGIKPKVRVSGFDLKVGSGIDTSLSSQAGNTFGSWGEYGVFSNGTNTNMASGSGLLSGGPNSQFFWSPLTFANTGFYGQYGGVTAPSFTGTGTPINSTIGITTFNPGDKRVLQYDGDLYITGNLTYANAGSTGTGYASIKDIPEIKIIANNIYIAPNVTQIDPWLIARNSAGTFGKISTCSTVAGFQPFSASGLLNSNMCQNELKLNGPVMADQLYAYRTKDAPGDAWAENFDLRASNFLSSYAGINTPRPVARTELITELPPRF